MRPETVLYTFIMWLWLTLEIAILNVQIAVMAVGHSLVYTLKMAGIHLRYWAQISALNAWYYSRMYVMFQVRIVLSLLVLWGAGSVALISRVPRLSVQAAQKLPPIWAKSFKGIDAEHREELLSIFEHTILRWCAEWFRKDVMMKLRTHAV